MKTFRTLFLILSCILILSSCTPIGGKKKSSNNPLVGTWIHKTDDSGKFGGLIRFTSDGKMRYGLPKELVQKAKVKPLSEKEEKALWDGIDMLITIEYKVLSPTKLQVSLTSRLVGTKPQVKEYTYHLAGDTLTLSGETFLRYR